MGSASKPSILLIPGSFGLPEFYNPVYDLVRAKGYEIRGLHKPSVGLSAREPRPGAPATMYDDAAYIAKEAEKLSDEGKDGLSKGERQQAGKPGGIVNIAYLTCLVPALGQSAKDVLATVTPENQINLKVQETGWMIHDQPEASAALSFSDLPLEEGVAWIKKFPQHSAISFVNELTHAGYKDVDVSWLFCEGDLVIPPQVQKDCIALIEKESGKKVDVTSIPRDHCPIAGHADEVADWIVKVAGKY